MTAEAHPSGETIYPAALREREWWVNWVLAYRHDELADGEPADGATPTKQPVAPYDNGTAEPCLWNDGLPDDEHPSTSFDDVVEWDGWAVGSEVPAPDRVISDELGVGIIIPVGGGEGRPLTLIDWDDVRDPDTGEIHPLCAYALDEAGGWAEISQSGEGIHQFVYGTIPDGMKKYIRHIDDDPFIGDDLPAVEMYGSGRLTAMTGRHVEGTGDDVAEGDDLITELVARTADYGNASTDTPTNPLAEDDDYETPSREEVNNAVRADVEFNGPHPDEWELDEDSSVKYAAVLRGRERSDELPNTANWELIGYAATIGKALGKSEADVRADLEAHPTPSYGYDPDRARKEVRAMFRKMEAGSTSPPSAETLKRRGLLPRDYVHLDEIHTDSTLLGQQKWETWAEARERGQLDGDSIVPTAALEYIARDRELYGFDALDEDADLPSKAHNRALGWVLNEWAGEVLDLDDDQEATARNYQARDATPPRTWEDVRYVYESSKEKGRAAARALLGDRYDLMTVAGTEELQVYDPSTGTYTDETGDLRGEIYDGLGEEWSTHELNEITAGLRQHNIVQPQELNGTGLDDPHICVKNGVLNPLTRELKDHSPEYHFVDRVPVTFDPDADTAAHEEFVDDLVDREADKKALFEMVGHALMPDANERYKKFLILTGDADNGKSAFYARVKALLDGPNGEENNTSSVKLAKLAQNRFSVNSMYGSMANIAGEIDGKKIRNTAQIKDITGGDPTEIEPKGKESFFDTINTTLMFAANDPPIIGERDKEAIATRIVPINLPFAFVDDPDGPMEKEAADEAELEARLDTPEGLSGLLNLALGGIERLEDNGGDVSLPETPEERLRMYERTADPMREFGERCLENSPGDYVVKADVTTIYKEFAAAEGYEVGTNIGSVLHGVLRGVPSLNYTESRPENPDYADTDLPLRGWDERKFVVDRVTLTEEGMKYAETAGLVVEEDDEEDVVDEDDLPFTPAEVDISADIPDRSEAPPIRATVAAVWENRYGQPVAELVGENGSVDLQIVGYDTPEQTPLSAGAEYRIEGLRGRNPDGEEPYLELRPTTTATKLNAAAEEEEEEENTTDADDTAEAAADGGETALAPDLPAEDAEGFRPDARRLAWILDGTASMTKTEIRNQAKAEFDMNLGRAGKVLEKAVEKTRLIEQVDDEGNEYRAG